MANTNPRFVNEKLRNFIQTSKGKTYTVGVVTGGLVLVLAVFGIFPSIRAIVQQASQNQSRIETLQQIEQKNQTLRQLANEIDAKTTTSQKLNQSLPNEIKQEDVIAQITEMARANNVSFDSVQFSKGSSRRRDVTYNQNYVAEAGLNLNVKGSRENVVQFANDMESSLRIFDLGQVGLGRRSGSGASHAMSLQATYYYWGVSQEDLMSEYRSQSAETEQKQQESTTQNNEQLTVEDVTN